MKKVKTILRFIDLEESKKTGTEIIRELNSEFEVSDERANYLSKLKFVTEVKEETIEENKEQKKEKKQD